MLQAWPLDALSFVRSLRSFVGCPFFFASPLRGSSFQILEVFAVLDFNRDGLAQADELIMLYVHRARSLITALGRAVRRSTQLQQSTHAALRSRAATLFQDMDTLSKDNVVVRPSAVRRASILPVHVLRSVQSQGEFLNYFSKWTASELRELLQVRCALAAARAHTQACTQCLLRRWHRHGTSACTNSSLLWTRAAVTCSPPRRSPVRTRTRLLPRACVAQSDSSLSLAPGCGLCADWVEHEPYFASQNVKRLAAALMKKMDRNHSGKVTFGEFCRFFGSWSDAEIDHVSQVRGGPGGGVS